MRDVWRYIYSKRGLLLPISSSRSRGVLTLAPPCKLVRDASGRLRVPRSTVILSTLSKSPRAVLITWSPSGYTPVRLKWPGALSSTCFLIKMWQLTKAHGVTRNETKIHVICYITVIVMHTPHTHIYTYILIFLPDIIFEKSESKIIKIIFKLWYFLTAKDIKWNIKKRRYSYACEFQFPCIRKSISLEV